MKSSLLLSFLSIISLASAVVAQAPKGPATPQGEMVTRRRPAPIDIATGMAPIIRNDAIVRVNATYQTYNPFLPWQKEQPGGRRGLGVVMPGNRILVTGQMAADATYIELELPESEAKIPAKVVGIDYEANLALLAPAADADRAAEFFSGLKPMELDARMGVGETLSIWQSGRVGDLIVTPLRVSKIMTAPYVVEGSTYLVYEGQGILRSEGNSFTLPVVRGGKLVGLLLRYDQKNQVTTVLPAPIIEHFLKDMADGNVEGFPSFGVQLQPTMDSQFREYLGLKPDQGGMYVNGVVKGNSADLADIKKGDIILSINGFKIDSRGDYNDPDFGRLSLGHIVRGRAFIGDTMKVVLLRDGKELTVEGKLTRKQPKDQLVWPYLFDRGPNYLVQGGLVFQELTKPYLAAFGGNENPMANRLSYLAEHAEDEEGETRKKIVFLSAVLPTPSAQGYDRLSGIIITKINGKPILQLADAAEAFKTPKNGTHVIELNDFPKVLHLDAAQVEKDNAALMGGDFRLGALSRIE
jgi:S1-C subfamily serine protease